MAAILISIINLIIRLFTLLVIVHIILSYFVDPFHPVRRFVSRLIEPLLAPIRRVIPTVGMLDFSPLVLLVVVDVIGYILIRILQTLSF